MAVVKLTDLAKTLNIIVYGKHEQELRNTGSEELSRELYDLENNIASWVELGLVTDYNTLKKTLVNIFVKKNELPL